MTNSAQIHELYKKVKRGNFYLSSHSFEIWDLLGGGNLAKNAKFQHDTSKLTSARPEKHGTWCVNTTL